MEVQSDFAIALRIREADGTVHTVARYSATHTEAEGMPGTPVPHLHRLDPSGSILATFDAEHSTMQLRRPSVAGIGAPTEIAIHGLSGAVREFRWLTSESGFAVATQDNLFVVPVAAESFDDGGVIAAEAVPVFPGEARGEGFTIADVRTAPTGLIVHTREVENWVPRGQVHHVRLAEGTVQELTQVLPDRLSAVSSTVGAGGEIRVSVELAGYDSSEELKGEQLPAVWTFAPAAEGAPVRTSAHACAPAGDDESSELLTDCHVTNWVPGSDRPAFAGPEWTNSPIVQLGGRPDGSDLRVFLYTQEELDEAAQKWGYVPELTTVDTLWSSHDDSRIMAANGRRLRSWDNSGQVLWTWTPPRRQLIHGAYFDEEERGALVTAGLSVYRVENGKGKRVLTSRGKYGARRIGADWESLAIPGEDDGMGGAAESFIDHAIELPGGAIAYSVVDLETRYIASHGDWEHEMIEPGGDPLDLLGPDQPIPLPEQVDSAAAPAAAGS